MDKIYVFGHKNPDTDSVCAAIALSYLRKLKKQDITPYVLGEINNETKYVLNYFKVPKPLYLNDVKLEVRDLNYRKNCYLSEKNTLNDLYELMQKEDVRAVPIYQNNMNYLGMVSIHELLNVVIDPHYQDLKTSYDNLLNILKGKEILRFQEEITGKICYSNKKDTFRRDSILVTSNLNDLEEALNSKVSLIILVGIRTINEKLLKLAQKNKVNIISTMKDLIYVSKMLVLSNYIRNIIHVNDINPVDERMHVDDFLTFANKYKFTTYPIVNRQKKILGLLRMEDVNTNNRKKVILVDHNENTQSVEGLEEAEILEIIDHHKVGNISSSGPINIRNMAVGSTNTIIYEMYKEQKVKPPKEMAGMMLSGIISDTLMLNSPTTTIYDKRAVEALANICKIDPIKYSKGMFEAAASMKGKTIEELIYNDFKAFNIRNRKIGIGQMTVIDYQKVLKEKDKYIHVIEKIAKEHSYDILAFCITDIINHNTYLLYNAQAKMLLETVFNIPNIEEGFELKGIVSRKMQIIPLLMEELK